jgi:hypothetical protein
MHPLAFCTAALAAASVPGWANTIEVQNCLDTGAGSLRDAVQGAVDNDDIDLTNLTCGSITLETGALAIDVAHLALRGPGPAALTISASASNRRRIVEQTASGKLTLSGLTLSNGFHYRSGLPSLGGCLYTAGDLDISNVVVSGCNLAGSNSEAFGGGIYSRGFAHVDHSKIFANHVYSLSAGGEGGGGGLYARGGFDVEFSEISDNSVAGASVSGGAAVTLRNATIRNSTIANNYSSGPIGGLVFANVKPAQTYSVLIENSTISGNRSGTFGGGLWISAGDAHVIGSTIVDNIAATAPQYFGCSPGIVLTDQYNAVNLELRSSIVAGNAVVENAIRSENNICTVIYNLSRPITITGSRNIVPASGAALPADTGSVCPLLGPLRDNGGPTPTRALTSGSPAVDAGDPQPAAEYDQRGAPYTRVIGAASDVGAYELDTSEIIFGGGFDGCP